MKKIKEYFSNLCILCIIVGHKRKYVGHDCIRCGSKAYLDKGLQKLDIHDVENIKEVIATNFTMNKDVILNRTFVKYCCYRHKLGINIQKEEIKIELEDLQYTTKEDLEYITKISKIHDLGEIDFVYK